MTNGNQAVAFDATKLGQTHVVWIQATRQTDLIYQGNANTFDADNKPYYFVPDGSSAPQKREIAAQTLEGIRNLVQADLNTSFRGAHLFAGTDPTTPPFVTDLAGLVGPYQGSAREMSVDIDETRSVTSGLVGSSISQGAAKTDLFSVIDAAAAAARTGDGHALAKAYADLRDAFTRAAQAQMRVGISLAAVAAHQPHLIDRRLALLMNSLT